MSYECRTAYQPATLWQFMNDLNRGFADTAHKAAAKATAWAPAIDVVESATGFTLEADLPGLKREDFDLEIIGDTLTLKGERKNGATPESGQYRRAERRYGAFERTFKFAEVIDASKVVAKFEDGVLHVTLPKPEQAQPHKVEITVH